MREQSGSIDWCCVLRLVAADEKNDDVIFNFSEAREMAGRQRVEEQTNSVLFTYLSGRRAPFRASGQQMG